MCSRSKAEELRRRTYYLRSGHLSQKHLEVWLVEGLVSVVRSKELMHDALQVEVNNQD